MIADKTPVEEPPNEPQAPLVVEPEGSPDKPTGPNKPPMEAPWNDPSQPLVEEPPGEDPNQAQPQPPIRRLKLLSTT